MAIHFYDLIRICDFCGKPIKRDENICLDCAAEMRLRNKIAHALDYMGYPDYKVHTHNGFRYTYCPMCANEARVTGNLMEIIHCSRCSFTTFIDRTHSDSAGKSIVTAAYAGRLIEYKSALPEECPFKDLEEEEASGESLTNEPSQSNSKILENIFKILRGK